jgi:hypothetical protein
MRYLLVVLCYRNSNFRSQDVEIVQVVQSVMFSEFSLNLLRFLMECAHHHKIMVPLLFLFVRFLRMVFISY